MTGRSYGGETDCDFVTIKYNPHINYLINEVEFLINSGILTEQDGNGLISRLEAAIKLLNKKKPNEQGACDNLGAFINQVNAHINSGKLSPEDGQD